MGPPAGPGLGRPSGVVQLPLSANSPVFSSVPVRSVAHAATTEARASGLPVDISTGGPALAFGPDDPSPGREALRALGPRAAVTSAPPGACAGRGIFYLGP